MALTYTNQQLKEKVGRIHGYGDSLSAYSAQQAADIAEFTKEGKARFYNPPVLPGERESHEWSFLTATHPFHLLEGVNHYDLPSGFAMLFGPIHFAIGSEEVRAPITLTSEEKVLYELQRSSTTGIPEIAAYRSKVQNEGDFLDGIHHELLVYPTPDGDYPVSLRYKIDPLAPTGNSLLPIGDAMHYQTLVEACLAAAERFNGEFGGGHEGEFMKLLQASISRDRKSNCPDFLGQNTDRSDNWDVSADYLRRGAMGGSLCTYNGVVPT